MNDTFDLKRFGWLLKKTLMERPVQLLGLVGLIMLIVLILYAACRYVPIPWEVIQDFTFTSGFVGGGCFLASFVFSYFSSNANGISYLTLPASSFEKWLCGVLIVGVIYTTVFLLFYRVIDSIFVGIEHRLLFARGPQYQQVYNTVKQFAFDGFVASKTYLMFLNFSGAMLIGTLYFNKGAFIKVALLACGLYIAGHFLNYFIASMFFGHIGNALPYYCVFLPVANDIGKIVLSSNASMMVDICSFFIVPAILWLVTFVRLREKEF